MSGSIVGMSDPDGQWSRHQGLVTNECTYHDSREYTVAVFFNLEISSIHFHVIDYPKIESWDKRHGKECRNGDTDFLFADSVWKECPRIVFFRPDELVVEEDWRITALAERIFPDRWHHIYDLKEGYPTRPEAYRCWMEGCRSPATRRALFNAWGSVQAFFVCSDCFPKVNGWCGDSFPRTKHLLYTPEGKAIHPIQ